MAKKTSYYKDPVVEKIVEDAKQEEESIKEEPKVLVLTEKKEEPVAVVIKEEQPIVMAKPTPTFVKPVEKQIEKPKEVPTPRYIAPSAPKPKQIKRLNFSGFYSWEENYKKITGLLSDGWKIVKEEKTTTSHKIVLEK